MSYPLRHFICRNRAKNGHKRTYCSGGYPKSQARANNSDVHDIIACIGRKEGAGRHTRVPEGSETSAKCREATLKHSKDSPQVAVEKENIEIPGGKNPPPRSLIENIQHKHIHKRKRPNTEKDEVEFIHEITRVRQPKKPRLGEKDYPARKTFCEWAKQQLAEGAKFIVSDESSHEIKGTQRKGPKNVSHVKGAPVEELAEPEEPVHFSHMHWGCASSEPMIGPQYSWNTLTQAEREQETANLQNLHQESVVEAKINQQLAEQEGTWQFEQLRVTLLLFFWCKSH